jgi:chromosome segregation ATPase
MLSNYRQETQQSRQLLEEYRSRTTELDAALLERKVEVERLLGRLRRAESDLAILDGDRSPRAQPLGKGAEEAPAVTRPATERLQQRLADAEERLGQQQSLLDEAGRQIQVLRERTQSAETELRQRATLAPERPISDGVKEELARQQEQIRELGIALATRTEEVQQARRQMESQQDRLRALESAESARSGETKRARSSRDGTRWHASSEPWLSQRRATTILSVLLFALCVVAITLVWLTVSADSQDILAGLGRLGAVLTGRSPR